MQVVLESSPMSLDLLKLLRLLVPGFLVVAGWALLGKFTGDWKVDTPLIPETLGKTAPAIIVAVLYYAFPRFRQWANRRNHDEVKADITEGLIDIGGGDAGSVKTDWKNIRPIFYRIVNSDQSLMTQSKRAMFNGLLWTSVADLKVISIGYAIVSTIYHFAFDSQGALIGLALSAFIAVATIPISWSLTKQHKEIGDKQLDIIRKFHSKELREYFEDE